VFVLWNGFYQKVENRLVDLLVYKIITTKHGTLLGYHEVEEGAVPGECQKQRGGKRQERIGD